MSHFMPEINTILKQLRLSHISYMLTQRTRESIEGKLSYPEFLSHYYCRMSFLVAQTLNCRRV
jgi:hypothetical protein